MMNGVVYVMTMVEKKMRSKTGNKSPQDQPLPLDLPEKLEKTRMQELQEMIVANGIALHYIKIENASGRFVISANFSSPAYLLDAIKHKLSLLFFSFDEVVVN
jgi:hypothetical protein